MILNFLACMVFVLTDCMLNVVFGVFITTVLIYLVIVSAATTTSSDGISYHVLRAVCTQFASSHASSVCPVGVMIHAICN
jgi:hypothetical protein